MNTLEAIASRRSIRSYKPDMELSQDQIRTLMTAAMHSPSANNRRPWEFMIVTDRKLLDGITAIHPYAGMLKTASAAVIVCINESAANMPFAAQDCAASTQNILLAAVELGLGSCWCGVYPNQERVNALSGHLGIPSGIIPFNVIAVGYPDECPSARGSYQESKVHINKW